jgi:uncharacterized protein YbaR (Trm112 family)
MAASPTTAEKHWVSTWKEKNKLICAICGDKIWVPMDDGRRNQEIFVCPACKRAEHIADKYRLIIIKK